MSGRSPSVRADSSREPSQAVGRPADGDLPAITANRERTDLTPMLIAACVSLCALPFVFLLITPWLGFRAALGTALALVVSIAVLCWLFCAAARLPGDRRWKSDE